MKDSQFLQDLLYDLVDLTQTAQEFHRNVRGDEYFCLHNSFGEDYDAFFDYQDIIGELLVKKGKKPNLSHTHKTFKVEDHFDMVSEFLKEIKSFRLKIVGAFQDMDFIDQGLISPIVNYCDVKTMKYTAFLDSNEEVKDDD